jgi:solute carrier family 25 (mitochondrial carnitine/acylcarnitine transporter), member 20/29
VTFLQDFVAGGMAGCASVIVGHPLDTLKVRVQNSTKSSSSIMAAITEFGGVSSLFRGMGAPLSAAAIVNAIVFSSYGMGSRLYDTYLVDSSSSSSSFSSNESQGSGSSHDPWQKAMTCGAFAGLVQCVVICPMEHVKCRLQIQHGRGSADNLYKGPYQAASRIVKKHGLQRLYQGWCSTVAREVPAFGLYFAVYDYMKDNVNALLARQHQQAYQSSLDGTTTAFQALVPSGFQHTHTWIASACAGGIAGSVTWGIVYPVDVSTYDD